MKMKRIEFLIKEITHERFTITKECATVKVPTNTSETRILKLKEITSKIINSYEESFFEKPLRGVFPQHYPQRGFMKMKENNKKYYHIFDINGKVVKND